MPKYLFTSDQRISELKERIMWVANYVQQGNDTAQISDKSDNNNASTLKFYYNLHFGTNTCKEAETKPVYAIRNFVKKFQFPNVRTSESLANSIEEKTFLAPFRSVVSILQIMASQSESGEAYISISEILYHIFGNPVVYKNPCCDYVAVVREIQQTRDNHIDVASSIDSRIEWKQYERQARELFNVLVYASDCFKLSKSVLYYNIKGASYQQDKTFLDELVEYKKFWFPSNPTDFSKSTLEYISYMDTKDVAYSVIEFNTQTQKHQTTPQGISEANNNILTALRTKPFLLLAGISGTGKSRIVRKLAQASVTEELQKVIDPKSVEKGFDRWELHKPANFELIQVKPNWHNSLEVVGYKSNIGGEHYEFTPFVEFVARAWQYPDVPFFLCLDEMNLAPVEQYFAEFLSAIESRSIEHGEYETDPIIKPFAEFGEKLCGDMINHLFGKVDASEVGSDSPKVKLVERLRTKGLTLPQNLLVLGTVNMDETTFSFSRKVLDRAMSIVMNVVEYDDFFDGKTENDMEELSDSVGLLIDRPLRGIDATDNGLDEVREYLKSVNAILDDTPFKLGYRAANEALLYVSAAHRFGQTDVNAALDEFTMMKILSRIEGDKRSIGNKLVELQEVINNNYPKSHKKLTKMAETLGNGQFVSYWT